MIGSLRVMRSLLV